MHQNPRTDHLRLLLGIQFGQDQSSLLRICKVFNLSAIKRDFFRLNNINLSRSRNFGVGSFERRDASSDRTRHSRTTEQTIAQSTHQWVNCFVMFSLIKMTIICVLCNRFIPVFSAKTEKVADLQVSLTLEALMGES